MVLYVTIYIQIPADNNFLQLTYNRLTFIYRLSNITSLEFFVNIAFYLSENKL